METIILIPPSEGKTQGGEHPPLTSLHEVTSTLLDEIKTSDHAKLYGLKEKALEEAKTANAELVSAQTLPAIKRYSGVVYQGISYDTLTKKKEFDKRVRIVSGLFGLVSPQDLLPNYRLSIDKLKADKKWHPHNSKELENVFVIDLLPKVHRKAVSYKNGIAVEFVIIKNGKKIPAGHNGKFIKGRFIRFIVENTITSPDQFSLFTEDGFSWNGTEFVKKVKQ